MARKSALFWVLLGVALVHGIGLAWGLPASDGWDNDGVAPRDFLAGLVETFTPGKYYTYPPVHLLLLGVLTAPITVVALAKAATFAPADVIHEILKVPYMTAVALVARGVSVAMSVGIAWAVAKIADEVRTGTRAGLFAAALCGLNAPLTYYAHTTNLDVPYLFWSSLALLALVRAIARREPRRLRRAALFAALAIGTKDQAYAMFLLAAPLSIGAWLWMDRWARANLRTVAREAAAALGIGAAALTVTLAVVFNPSGFRERVHYLVGSASQDFAHYSTDAKGLALVVLDSLVRFHRYYPAPAAVAVIAGLVIAVRARSAAGLVPLFAALSFTLLFNCTARRTEHRFLLPQMVAWSVYAGVALDALFAWARRVRAEIPVVAALGATFGWALFKAADVDANLLLDPRYEAEAWLSEHTRPGDLIEVHGLNVYLPRFPAQARVIRVGHEPTDKRNPLPGVMEVQDDYGHAERRAARFIVVSEGWVWRYLIDLSEWSETSGKVLPKTQLENSTERDGTTFFQALVKDQRGYRKAHASTWTSPTWPRLDIHASTAREIWIYERK